MSASGSTLALLLSEHDLKLVCTQCSVKQREITYTLKSVRHQCARNLLLCKAKGGSVWRPVSRRPAFPNPSQYEVCHYFVEGFGCTFHKNRCTFARSQEEAAVWTFEKHQRLDHVVLCHFISQAEGLSDQPVSSGPLSDILATLDLKAVCDLCSLKQNEITYVIQSVSHKCNRSLLLAKAKDSDQWRPVSERPTCGHFGQNVLYQKCNFFVEGSGCLQHKEGCTYARSEEEATVWNYVRDKDINIDELIRGISESKPISTTPESEAENILQQFSGEFKELCKVCFHEQKLTTKRWNETCAADAAHVWDPVLVHHMSENGEKQIYSQVRPLPQNCALKYCSHVRQGKPCWHKASHCMCAQSEVEMAVWKAEHSRLLVRPHLLQLSRQGQAEARPVSMYCKVCLLVLSSPESFYKHCSSLEHARLLSEDTVTKWRGRQPPHSARAEFWLCERPQTCEYGNKCPKAHSEEELKEWMMRAAEEKEIRQNIEAQGLMCYTEKLLEEYKNSSNEVHVISEQVDDVRVTCNEELTLECEQINAARQWHFKVETERQLVHVALLKQEPGASFTLGDISSVPSIYSSGEHFLCEDMTYDITVSFMSINPGLYEQWLVLDFDMRPVLLKKLRVRVGQLSLHGTEETTAHCGATFQSVERWHRGNRVIIPCSSRTEEQEELLQIYKPPQMSFLYKASYNSQKPLNKENYKERMHHFLYNEEQAEDQIVSRLNVCGEITTMETLKSPQFGMLVAPQGQLFCAVSISYNLTSDTPEGQVLKRSIQYGLIAPLSSGGQNSKVYEALILQVKTCENKMYLQLSRRCCSELALKSNESYQMEVQFQLNRYTFCTMHKAVDLLPDTTRVLPELENCVVPVHNGHHEKLNTKQQSALDFITGNCSVQKCVPPLLIYGPFGTGKTFTLAAAARELCKQPDKKVLICTHTNSSADVYVRVHLHPFINEKTDGMRPIRLKANTQRALSATDEITLKYCFLSENRQNFLPPSKAVLDRHRIVITTTTMARNLYDLKLPEDYFTHILIDEASQMLECEALMALGLAGPNTRVVLAGDHMQMGPKLFSVDDHHRSNHTLLNRLFHYYQGQKCDAAHNSRIIFSENYRSTKEIVEFVSTHFYVGKNDVIKASGNIPAPAKGHALKFHHVRGECLLDPVSRFWYNKEEITKVVEEVKKILEDWPLTWGEKDQSSICVLSEGIQVQHIRKELKREHFPKVPVENLANVQGKQFRAVIITAVQTRDSLKTSHLPGLELFNDARVFNTAMTRAQSQVVVVGDAAALCCFGKCSKIWKSYTDHCINNNSVAPQHFTKDFFERDVMETAKFQKSDHMDESNTLSDTVLQELRDEYERLTVVYSSDEDNLDLEDLEHRESGSSSNTTNVNKHVLDFSDKYPVVFEKGKIIRESNNRGYFIPFQNPSTRKMIKGRANLGKAFTGDEVVFQTDKVVSITKEEESARVLVCLLEDEDHSKPRKKSENRQTVRRMMIPITKSAPKVCILISKKTRNFLPIWEKINGQWTVATKERLNEKLRQNSVFVVQVIGWKEGCHFPLGNVIEILPVRTSIEHGIKMLNEEFKVTSTTSEDLSLATEDEGKSHRKDICKVITFTVDPKEAKNLDDAISVKDIGEHYELGVHIADVASFVSPRSELDETLKHRGIAYHSNTGEPIDMFPRCLNTGDLSLLEGKRRQAVSVMLKVDKQTNEIIGEPKFQLSLIESNKKFSYEEAEKEISKRCEQRLRFDTVEDCVTVAYCFAKTQRRRRLGLDWAYCQSDDHRLPGNRKAKLMIEELSVLFNTVTAKTLVASVKTRYYTPVRCQSEPDPERVEQLKEKKCAEWILLSFHVRHKVDHDEQAPDCENFRILTKVWEDIQSAARANDVHNMVDLIAADDIHPLLQPLIDEFRRCSSKAYVVRFDGGPKAEAGHYSLKVRYYTQATSPIRRYMDIILQRLLHSIICNKNVTYTRTDISTLCSQFEENIKKAKEYEQKAEQISYAVSMKKQSASKLAFVVSVDPYSDRFAVSFPFNKSIFVESLSVMYKDLQLQDQPSYDEKQSVTLKWKKRIYAIDTVQIYKEMKTPDCNPYIEFPLTVWKDTVKAIDEENWDHAKSLILGVDTKQLEKQDILPQASELLYTKTPSPSEEQEAPAEQMGHEVDIILQLQTGDTLQVQMTSELKRGYHMPALQLVHIKAKFEICVDHVHNPIACFSKSTDDPSMIYYRDTEQYIQIWKPLCEMESAATAVDESDSIIIENLVVNFKQEQEGSLTGSFFLPVAWINEWAIECNLSKCLLCIRKRGLNLTSKLEHSALVDPRQFTWVAHGVTKRVEERPNEGSKVEFYINHLPMETFPDCVFQRNTSFTVEIIPKLVPDIRKETAVVSIRSACHLVQTIALGRGIPRGVKTWHHIMGKDPPNELPELNLSQKLAVDKAVNNPFTLIQGPPGTGKTVVGVHIVYHLFKLNSENPRECVDPKDQDKKQVILYCGPSNKSIDVVAEYLLKIGDSLRPLRVYSQQVEMLDYPYPDSDLQFTQRSLRQERAKPELRNITLHHRMRQDQNPYSGPIKDFDRRIQLAVQKKDIQRALREKEQQLLKRLNLDKIEELSHIQLALEELEELKHIQVVLEEKEEALRIKLNLQEKEELRHIQLAFDKIKELRSEALALEEVTALTPEEVKRYKQVLRDARTYELKQHDIIMCTCTQSSTPSLTKTVSARQILIDECAMATEPQALIPLVCNTPEKIILIGDHKQLQPIVKNARVRKLGMGKSLFERYQTMPETKAVMLDTQYRMHENICKFPSEEYYDGKLKTGVEQPSSVLRVKNKITPIVFGNVEGETIRLVVSTAKGNENSQANKEERDKVIAIAKNLVDKGKIEQKSIAILSPYNAQVSDIRNELRRKKMDQITVTTITKSQGSEWRYVIISTVCSLPSAKIENEPDGAWLSKHLGFVGFPNQINVGITRAKEGLCIIGNQKLLRCSRAWRSLLDHYTHHNAVTEADQITVHSA